MVWHVLQDMAQDMGWHGMATGTWQLARGCSSVVGMVWQGMVWYVMAMVWQEGGGVTRYDNGMAVEWQ